MKFANQASRVASEYGPRADIRNHNRARANYCAAADRHPSQNRDTTANPNIIFQSNWPRTEIDVIRVAAREDSPKLLVSCRG